jgi:putative endopeptidase
MRRVMLAVLVAAVAVAARPEAADPEHYLDRFIDPAREPREDFFRYAVGKWLRENPSPRASGPGRGRRGPERSMPGMRGISRTAASARARLEALERKVGDFLDPPRWTPSPTRAWGFAPLDSRLRPRFAGFHDLPGLVTRDCTFSKRLTASARSTSCPIERDEAAQRSSTQCTCYQGGLGLPDRDYYFDPDARMRRLRQEYVRHVARMFRLHG